MKKMINISRWPLLFGILLLLAAACNKNEDLVTANAKTGGLVEPTATFFYALGVTTEATIVVDVPTGPQITEIKIYNTYFLDGSTSSNEVLLATLTGFGSSVTLNYTYAQLREGLVLNGQPLPAADTSLPIGSWFTLRYETTLADGRVTLNVNTTTIGISNFFAGQYQVTGVFHHPTAGDRAINEKKDLIAINAFECTTTAGDLAPDYPIKINIDPATNTPVVYAIDGTPDMTMTPGKTSTYDPATGIIQLYYQYEGATGTRAIEETYTPL